MDLTNIIDKSASLGDHKQALKGLWCSLAQSQTQAVLTENMGVYLGFLVKSDFKKSVVHLRRSFNQPMLDGTVIKFWRVVEPGHVNDESDLSYQGLVHWNIIKGGK
jgi:hypothetical protein